ncbi:MAG: sortase [Clostridia bacterium]|nr:sortase [Clostridia bacterium]
MFESKYSGFLTALLVIIIFGIICVLGYLGFTFYQQFNTDKAASDAVDAFIEEVSDKDKGSQEGGDAIDNVEDTPISSSGTRQLNGYNIVGTIEIPATDVKYPILEKVTKGSIETAVAVLYGPGPNQEGNTVIVGHNYRNGQFFSNNKKLSNGDKIYITDTSGKKLVYTIYNKFETTPEDTTFYTKNTNGAREVTLSTCTDNSKARIIIEAKADDDA